jgi:hypothetical protein
VASAVAIALLLRTSAGPYFRKRRVRATTADDDTQVAV